MLPIIIVIISVGQCIAIEYVCAYSNDILYVNLPSFSFVYVSCCSFKMYHSFLAGPCYILGTIVTMVTSI